MSTRTQPGSTRTQSGSTGTQSGSTGRQSSTHGSKIPAYGKHIPSIWERRSWLKHPKHYALMVCLTLKNQDYNISFLLVCNPTLVLVHGYSIPSIYNPSCGPPIIPNRAKAACKIQSRTAKITKAIQ